MDEKANESASEAAEPITIGDLARLGGVNRRTVRYYVQRGLLAPPIGSGRGAHYTRAHLDRLIRVRELQEAGVALKEIAARLSGREAEPEPASEGPPPFEAWTRAPVIDGVELHVRGRVLDSERLAALARFTEALVRKPRRR